MMKMQAHFTCDLCLNNSIDTDGELPQPKSAFEVGDFWARVGKFHLCGRCRWILEGAHGMHLVFGVAEGVKDGAATNTATVGI